MKKVLFILSAVLLLFTFTLSPYNEASAAPKRGGVLKVIYGVGPNLLGHSPQLQRNDDITAVHPCVEPLLKVEKSGKCIPWLASSYKGDAKAKTVTIGIRKGVKFHDGSDLNAEVVKWNLEEYRNSKKPELKGVTSIDIIDDYTVRLNLEKFDNMIEFSFTGYAGMIYSKSYFEKHGADSMRFHPVGTGPFKFVSFERDVSLKFERFDGYWQEGKPYLDGMEFLYIADPMVRLASFQAGEGDVLLAVEPQDAKTLEKIKGVSFINCLGTNIGLAGDGDHPDSPFADIRVRQAIEYAIDREPVVEAIGLGFWEASDQTCSKSSWGYYPGPSPYSYNPQKAKELLTEAGYPNGLNLPLVVRNNPAAWLDLYTAILAQLNEAGFSLHLEVVDPARFNEYAIKTAWKNSMLGLNFTDAADADRILFFGWSSFGFPYRAVKHYDEIDNTIKEAISTDDFEVKKAKTHEAFRLIRDKYCTLTNICLDALISARHGYVHDDGFFSAINYQSTIEDAWMDR